ncbi:GNAT family N-acetyltransferase [Hymenobacter sp. BT730]|uniref:GNAT family N-acetyltransferase n=1 Tax=Hymenobacter sp. BT730 TaxID=3063332 RepID=UPI0026DEFBEA|nr:GNAT family N-acetyltransferase [Hymenobacter sp. BT730]
MQQQKPQIQHNQEEQEFTVLVNGYTAELAYSLPDDCIIDFTHTFVEEELRGQKIGDALAHEALQYARGQKLRVKATCSFMKSYLHKHHEKYADMLA